MKEKRAVIIGIFIIATVFIFSRIQLFWGRTFPLGDGGMFYTIVEQMKTSLWPTTFEYNGQMLPFAYPPLAFWLARIVLLLPLPQITLFTYLPLLYNTIFVALLSYALWTATKKSVLATTFFSILVIVAPQSFQYLTYGGGVVRGLGSIFFAATLISLLKKNATPPLLKGLFPALALLTHPEWGLHSLLLCILATVFDKPQQHSKRVLIQMLAPILVVFLIYSIRILFTSQFSAYLGALQTAATATPYLDYLWNTLQKPEIIPYLALGVLSSIMLLQKHSQEEQSFRWIFVHFLMVIFLIHRNSYTFIVLEGIVLGAMYLPYALKTLPLLAIRLGALILLLFALISYPTALQYAQDQSINGVISLPPESTFLAITTTGWFGNSLAEWQPALSNNVSVLTVQGSEWLTPAKYRALEENDSLLFRRALRSNPQSVTELIHDLQPNYIIVKPETLSASPELSTDIVRAGYTLVLDMQQGYVILGKLCAAGTCQAVYIAR